MRFKSHWDDLTQKMGYWVDLDNSYITFENDYIESVWHNLKQLWDKNLLYKGYTIQRLSSNGDGIIKSFELNQPGAYPGEVKPLQWWRSLRSNPTRPHPSYSIVMKGKYTYWHGLQLA